MKCSASCYLALALLFGGLFAYFDAVFYKLLVIEYQVLFQSSVGYIATIGSFLYILIEKCTTTPIEKCTT